MNVEKQMAALRELIFLAKDGTDLSKRILVYLLNNSQNLTCEVCLSLMADREGYSAHEIKMAAYGVHDMISVNGSTHIDEALAVTGEDFLFTHRYGDYDPTRPGNPLNNDGQFAGFPIERVGGSNRQGLIKEGMPMRHSFWLAKQLCSEQAALLPVTREELEKIDLSRPGLYPNLENQKIAA